MPDFDSHVFSSALSVFLVFGAGNLALELMISLIVSYKRLKATVQNRYSFDSGKLEAPNSWPHDQRSELSPALLAQIIALSPADRRTLSSFLEACSGSVQSKNRQEEDQDLGLLSFPRSKTSSKFTH